MDGHFSVQRFYSRTSSFLMIEPEPKELRCDQEKIVTVHYSLNSEAYSDDSNINFFYLVSLSGSILGSCLIVHLAQYSSEPVHQLGCANQIEPSFSLCWWVPLGPWRTNPETNKHIKISKVISVFPRLKKLFIYFKLFLLHWGMAD